MKPILGPLEIRRRLIREELGTRERMCDKMKRLQIALHLWIKHGIQWRDQYAKFGPFKAWYMAGVILDFRQYLRDHGLRMERF